MNTSILEIFAQALDFVWYLIPIAIPILLLAALFDIFLSYTRQKYFNSLDWVLLEITPSPETVKSPAAMELFLLALYQTGGEATWIDRIIKGKVRTWFSLEIVSLGGNVKFHLYCESRLQKFIESQIYAQYPGVEVRPVEDYAAQFNTTDFSMSTLEMELVKPDPYPIKTYMDYGLDKEMDEEYKIDPITPVLEFFTTIPEDNYACIQIIVRAHRKEDKDTTKIFPSFSEKVDNWKETSKSEIKRIKEESFIEVEEGDIKKKQNVQTETQKRVITALDKSVTKFAFDTGVRLLYIGKKESFENNFGILVGTFKQYNSDELNSFKPRSGSSNSFDYPWQDPFGTKVKKISTEMLEAYQTRNYFWKDNYKKKTRPYFILNTEELATIYHFPGMVAQTPTLNRVDSKKATPPSDLPI